MTGTCLMELCRYWPGEGCMAGVMPCDADDPRPVDFGEVLDEFTARIEHDEAADGPRHVATCDGICSLAETGWPQEGSPS